MSASVAAKGGSKQCKASRASLAPESRRDGGNRRRQSSRGVRQGIKMGSSELNDLILASKLVPTGRINSVRMQQTIAFASDALSTAVPSSAEQSPELKCISSHLWPSLRKSAAANAGWELCSEASEIEALPSPALDIEGVDFEMPSGGGMVQRWLLLGDNDEDEPSRQASSCQEKAKEVQAKSTFADLMRDGQAGQFPIACRTLMPPMRMKTSRRRNAAVASSNEIDSLDDNDHVDRARWHGWKAQHKASGNAKQQLKVADRKAKRIDQSCRSRGWTEDRPHTDEV